jgi:hypothetical protein
VLKNETDEKASSSPEYPKLLCLADIVALVDEWLENRGCIMIVGGRVMSSACRLAEIPWPSNTDPKLGSLRRLGTSSVELGGPILKVDQ